MKIKLFVAREIQYFELAVFSFNSYVYYLSRGFIASTHAFNLLIRAFSLPTHVFNLATRTFSVLTREFELVTCGFELVTREFELLPREFELVTRGFEFAACKLCFSFPQKYLLHCSLRDFKLNFSSNWITFCGILSCQIFFVCNNQCTNVCHERIIFGSLLKCYPCLNLSGFDKKISSRSLWFSLHQNKTKVFSLLSKNLFNCF